jgi:hypothetical protein
METENIIKAPVKSVSEGLVAVVAIASLCVLGFSMASCRVIKPYEKEYLVHPIMDDARVERLSAPYGKSVRPNERLATAGAGGGSSTSCPTCGGK